MGERAEPGMRRIFEWHGKIGEGGFVLRALS
jgi:hypothetical protein